MVAGDQRLVHTPFVSSGPWGPCASHVWIERSPAAIGESFISTNPSKAPDIRFSGNRLCSKTFKARKNISETNNNNNNPSTNTSNHNPTIGNNNNNNNHDVNGKQNDLLPETAATLGSGDLRLAVRLPEGEDLHEWIAINTVDFFNQINMLYGTLLEFCTDDTCPIMSAGPKYEYHWADGQTVKKPLKCSAPHYIDCLMIWIQKQLENEAIFPSKIGRFLVYELLLLD
ncbi:unnamed protein product [Schistosoma curassoni]|uniref:MOB kinase activator-like 1 n=1 Tax=Schistosoma curassoni TaxID=6186 RepID=A0A183KDX4_9TREM|nr:unnamed protein product [Schistosoma curassoni]